MTTLKVLHYYLRDSSRTMPMNALVFYIDIYIGVAGGLIFGRPKT